MAEAGPLTLRLAAAGDAVALRRLAERDSALVPAGRLVLAEVGGELRAARALGSGETIADPFEPTAHLLELLAARARELERGRGGRRRPLGARAPRLGRAFS
jgi:hypothetical protein